MSYMKFNTIALVFLAAFIGNAFVWQSVTFGLALAVGFFLIMGKWVGAYVLPDHAISRQMSVGTWMTISVLIIVASIGYYLFQFTPLMAYVFVLLGLPIALFLQQKHEHHWWHTAWQTLRKPAKHPTPTSVWISAGISLLSFGVALEQLIRSATTEAVRSPWLAVPDAFFVAVFIGLASLVALLLRGRERALSIPLTGLWLFLFLSVALFVFPLGFGFDTFIHKATELHIAEHGTIDPKPLYYVGQYVVVLFLHYAFHLPVEMVDTFLVPVLSAVTLPFFWYVAARHLFPNRQRAAATIPALFLIPLGSLIVTTPQGLANLWSFLLALAAVPILLNSHWKHRWWMVVPAIAALLIHPIAGIPAVLFAALILTQPDAYREGVKHIANALFWIIAVTGSVVLPVSFLVLTLISGLSLTFDTSALNPQSIFESLHIDRLLFATQFQPLLDFVYTFGAVAFATVILLAVLGRWRVRGSDEAGRLRPFWVMAGMLFVNYLLLSTAVDFTFLIDYERLNYANRLIPLMAFFLAPLFILGVGFLGKHIRRAPVPVRIISLLLVTGLVMSAFYLTYPRDDAYETHHGFNVSQSDLNAVRFIDKQAGETPYIALANQSVSAAAMYTLGFDHYYGEMFFYPIPTGGELYRLFLDMNERPGQATADTARRLVNDACEKAANCDGRPVTRVFYIVNEYWWESERLIETGKQTADHWTSLDDGAVHIFEY